MISIPSQLFTFKVSHEGSNPKMYSYIQDFSMNLKGMNSDGSYTIVSLQIQKFVLLLILVVYRCKLHKIPGSCKKVGTINLVSPPRSMSWKLMLWSVNKFLYLSVI